MTAILIAYLGIALLDAATDAAICFACKRRFKAVKALLASLFWPLTLPVSIISAALITRNYPTWDD